MNGVHELCWNQWEDVGVDGRLTHNTIESCPESSPVQFFRSLPMIIFHIPFRCKHYKYIFFVLLRRKDGFVLKTELNCNSFFFFLFFSDDNEEMSCYYPAILQQNFLSLTDTDQALLFQHCNCLINAGGLLFPIFV